MGKFNNRILNRRDFLKISTAAAACSLIPTDLVCSNQPKAEVWEIVGNPEKAVEALFSSIGGIKTLIRKELGRAAVLIKPNLCLPHQTEMGTTTSPEVVDALCRYLIRSGVKRIIITDHTLKRSEDFSNIELFKIAEQYPEVKLSLANEQRLFYPVSVNGKALKSTEILKIVQRVDLLINLATAKHHSATHVSLALKNLMGLIWNRTEFHTRFDLSQAIADLAGIINPGINIIDASRVLLSGGPVGPGPVKSENRLFASFDMLSLDAVVVDRYNFGGRNLSAKEVPHLLAAHKDGVGEINIQNIQINKIEL